MSDPAAGDRPLTERQVLTVSQLNALVGELLAEAVPPVWVEGEISNLRRYPSGHTYFTLKDESAQIAAVLFRGNARGLRFRPEDGLKVLVRGRVGLYQPRGSYQVLVEALEPAGLGALQLAFEQLKLRLQAEGLFDPHRKRPLPALPRRIGIVTSPEGAAIRDILRILRRRFTNLAVVVAPARVQGAEAAAEIVAGIRDLHRLGGVDVIVVTRGGGSIEDLWPFNEEIVARAIAASKIPVISAVGHEIDLTISDLVADLRAPTPSAAAEMVVRSRQELVESIAARRARLVAALRIRLANLRNRLESAGAERAFASLRTSLRNRMQGVDDLGGRLRSSLDGTLLKGRHRLEILGHRLTPRQLAGRMTARRAACQVQTRLLLRAMTARVQRAHDLTAALGERLGALSPLAVLGRGYAICYRSAAGTILKDARSVDPGERVSVRLQHGRLGCEVKEVDDATSEEGL